MIANIFYFNRCGSDGLFQSNLNQEGIELESS